MTIIRCGGFCRWSTIRQKEEITIKKIITLVLALVLVFALAACGVITPPDGGNTNDPEIENKVDLSLDKSTYAIDEHIAVTLDFDKLNQSTAIIVLVKSDTEHGKAISYDDESAWAEYRWLADFSEVPFYLYPHNTGNGLYDVRVYADAESGEELASVTIAIGNATLPAQGTEVNPPKDGSTVKRAFFNPPTAIYMDVRVGGTTATEGTFSFALLDGNYSYTLNPDGVFFHISAEVKTYYCPYGDGWAIDNDEYGYGEVPEEDLIYEMKDYLDTFIEDAESNGYYNNISKYYIGTETVCYRNCYVYEIKDDGYGVYKKFWVDSENGATLKYVERKGNETLYEFEVTQYNLLGPVWTNVMRPDYATVTDTLF